MNADADEVNFLGDSPPCVYCGYQSCNCPRCTCIRLTPAEGPCPGCRRHNAIMSDRKFRRLPEPQDVIDIPDCGGQTLNPPCGACERCMREAFPCDHPETCPCPGCQRYRVDVNVADIEYTPLDALGVAKDVLKYDEVSYTKPVRYTDPTLSPPTQLTDASLHGPRCVCGHVRLDHFGQCCFEGCKCKVFAKDKLEARG
jgi:hypothetical protein